MSLKLIQLWLCIGRLCIGERGAEMVSSLKKRSEVPDRVERAKQTRRSTSGATARQMNQYGINEKEFHDLSSIIKPDGAKKADLVTFSNYSRGQTL